ncbi:EVE domain-containing protein [Bryobacter aggregatus]|uniref:EVE domain-containing protein n=1 Tax=Bryobacter aggregatus TaxID=360054 RepID=UPI0004E20E93|nr:EVE domain-containing protein [Bryobacter aggregatus]
MKFYLAKSDPLTYSFDDLERDGKTVWDGVKNHQALQAIRLMKDGDCVVCYHSQGQAAIVGWGYVEGDARPDPNDPKLAVFTYRFGGRLAAPVTLHQIKATGLFPDFQLVRNSRLSTMALPPDFVAWLRKTATSFKP